MPKINDEYDIGKAFEAIENELIASMMRNMRSHKEEEIKEDKQWTMWQAEQLKALEEYKKINHKKYGKRFKSINLKIEELIRTAKDEGDMEQEIAILEAIKKGFPAKRISKGAAAEFFKLNERKLEALIKATTDDMKKAETAVLRMAEDQYRKIIFNAQVYANTGAGTYEKAVDMAARDFLSAGLNCVEYANGARHTLSDYADMAIRTACKRAYLQGEGVKRQEWGIHTVIVNKRGNPCPKCLPFCGKVLIDDVWSGGSRKDGDYPLMSTAVAYGLYHPRCKDSHTTYFPGISTADDTWTKEELEAIGLNAKWEARQQYAERQEKRFGRLAENSLDPENQNRYEYKSRQWKEIEASYAEQIDFPKFFRRKEEKELEIQKKRFYRSLLHIEDEDIYQMLREAYLRADIQRAKGKRSYFNREEKRIYITKEAGGDTIAHELFHEIDYLYGITEHGALTKEISKDYFRLSKMSRGKTIGNMLYSKYPDIFDPAYECLIMKEKYRGISDILNGMLQGKENFGYGHSKEYWKREKALERETWAQCGRMYYAEDEEVHEMIKQIFPNVSKEFERILKEMVK